MNLCQLCRGSRWLVSFSPLEYWCCPACEAVGTRGMTFEPAMIGPSALPTEPRKDQP